MTRETIREWAILLFSIVAIFGVATFQDWWPYVTPFTGHSRLEMAESLSTEDLSQILENRGYVVYARGVR